MVDLKTPGKRTVNQTVCGSEWPWPSTVILRAPNSLNGLSGSRFPSQFQLCHVLVFHGKPFLPMILLLLMDAKNRVIASLLDRGHCLWGKLGYFDASASDIESSSDAKNRDSIDFSLIVENMVEALRIFSFRHHEPSSLQRLGVASPKQFCGVICDWDSDCEDSWPSSWFNVLPKSLKSFPSYV